MATEGLNQKNAAERAGMTAHGLQQALTKPHVREYLDGIKDAHMSGKTFVAWGVVHDLMENSPSDDVRHKAARTHLESVGQLGNAGSDRGGPPMQLIQIVVNPAYADQAPYERLEGVTEAPPVGWAPGAAVDVAASTGHPLIRIGSGGGT